MMVQMMNSHMKFGYDFLNQMQTEDRYYIVTAVSCH